jgi:hypothetical protein
VTFHFAYPNVFTRQEVFIGCGRYTLFASDETPGPEYIEVQGVPNTPNKTALNRVAQLLAPESYDSTMSLFHKQDQEDKKYQGDSLDLAWFLTHVLRACRLRLLTETDIWCSGILQVDGSGVHLLDVEQHGFYLKLQAFLDAANKDLLFIVPLPNLNPQARRMCEESEVQVLRIGEAATGNIKELSGNKKIIFAVAADELQLLLNVLFIFPKVDKARDEKDKKTKRYILLFLLLLIVIAGFAKSIFESEPVAPPVVSVPAPEASPEPTMPPQSRTMGVVKPEHLDIPVSNTPFVPGTPLNNTFMELSSTSEPESERAGSALVQVPASAPELETAPEPVSEIEPAPDPEQAPVPGSAQPEPEQVGEQQFELMQEQQAAPELQTEPVIAPPQQNSFFQAISRKKDSVPAKRTGLGRKLTDEEW